MVLHEPRHPMISPAFIFRFHFVVCACLSVSTLVYAQTRSEDFEDGSLSPFSVEIVPGNVSEIVTPAGFAARAGSKVHRLVWHAANYDGTRASKSVEGSSGGGGNPKITTEGWYGFSFYAPESFPVPGKQMVLGQIHAWHGSLPNTNITITVGVEPGGKLVLEGAYGTGDGGKTVTVYAALAPLLTKGGWHDLVLYCKFSRNHTGILRAWLDGAPESAPTASFTGINLGNGAWTGDTEMTQGAYLKWGPYCWDSTNYTTGESREIFYDEIAYEVGNTAGAFDRVKPSGYGTGYAAPAAGPVVMAETFDTMTTGNQPTGMTVVKGAGTALTVREIPSATDKCMQFYDPNPDTRIEATKTFAAQSSRVAAAWSFRQNGQAEGHGFALLSGSLPVVELRTSGGNLVYRDGSGADHILQAIPPNTWHDVEVVANPATSRADVYVGGLRRITGATFRNAAAGIDRIRFGTSDESATRHLYINDIVVAQAPPVFSETYDAMTTGNPPDGWTRTLASGTALRVREVPGPADKSMQFYDPNPDGKAEAFNTFVPQTSGFTAGWSFRQTGQAEGHRMALAAGTTATAVEFFTAGGNLVYRNGAGTDVVVDSIPANVWHDVRVAVRPAATQADVYVNGVLKLSNQSLRNPVAAVDRVVFGTSDISATYHFYIDDVFVVAGDAAAAP